MTEEIKIDPETGLPELPEGLFWEVSEQAGLPVISIVGRKSLTWVDDKGRAEKPYRDSYGWPVYDYLKVVEADESPALDLARKTGNTKEARIDVPMFWPLGEMGFARKKAHTLYEVETFHELANVVDNSGNFDWTEKSVALVALNVYEEWRSRAQKQTRKARLIGIYPPKRLEW